MTTYNRHKAAVQRLLRKYGGGAVCTVVVPNSAVQDPDKPWIVDKQPDTQHTGIPCVFLPTDFRFDTSAGYWPEHIVPEARFVALVSGVDLPIMLREGHYIIRQDGSKVAVLRSNVIAPDSLTTLLHIAQVTGGLEAV